MDSIGLNDKQVAKSRMEHGSNKLPEPHLKTWFDFAKESLNDSIIRVLIAITGVYVVLSALGVMEWSEPIVIITVLGIVTAIGVKTGLGVQKSSEDLRKRSSTRYCDVIRNGKITTINKDDIVVGDLVCLSTGQEIFADGYIVEGKVSVNNAAINGETKECRKSPIEGYVHKKSSSTLEYVNQNCLFAGTIIMSGEGKMIVTDVGVNTVNGDTLVKMQTLESPKTALDIALDKLSDFISKWGTIAAITSFGVLMITGIFRNGFTNYFGSSVWQAVKVIATNVSIALTIIVAAVPEGLPLIVKLVMKQNVKTMELSNILAKNPGKIPELAYVDLICTDKTGTLTTGIMTPKIVVGADGRKIDKSHAALWELLEKNIILNSGAAFDSMGKITGGNSIDRALMSLIDEKQYIRVKKQTVMLDKQVFSSENKYSAFSVADGPTFYKGAPEKIIEKCSSYFDGDGSVCTMEDSTKDYVRQMIAKFASQSMRCIVLALSLHTKIVENVISDDLTFIGVIGVVDPVRPEVPEAVRIATRAGIQVIEITGDCIETAVSVAQECGIYKEGDIALTNDKFETMSDDEVCSIIPRLRVVSRCSPSTKLRLVSLSQRIGRSVAMTGDGVNDSPALKRADVGFGMQGGSDVAKEASDIILTDDNFASVVKAVELGRTFMHNIMMFLEFQLPINISLLILNIIYPFLSGNPFLASVQILIINIIMDSLNSLSFGGEPSKKEYMLENPLKKGSGLFICGSKARIALSTTAFIGVYCLSMLSPIKSVFESETDALTARFALLCFMAVFNGFNIRTDKINLFSGLSKNKLFIQIAAGIFVGTILLCNVGKDLVKVNALDLEHWIVIICLAFLIIPIDIFRKINVKEKRKNGIIQ